MKPLCFVLMPFGVKADVSGIAIDFDGIYSDVIAPAIRDADLEPLRADEEIAGGIIHKAMFERLVLCEFAIADLTTANANVFYELGVRHAVRPHTTVLIFCQSSRLPFDVNLLRGMPYSVDSGGKLTDQEGIRVKLAESLRKARSSALYDSPLYQLLEDYPNIQHEKTDVFRDRISYSLEIKQRLAKARDASLDALESVAGELEPFENQEVAIVVDLMLSYRAVKAWDRMVELIDRMPSHVSNAVMMLEQKAFALNRLGKRQAAEAVLSHLLQTRGPSSETYGLLGRVYKDTWEDALSAGKDVLARGFLSKAVDAYLAGFESDWRDAYPGVNAVTLMAISEPPDPRLKELLPVVKYAVQRRIMSGKPDYWDYATMLELAVIENDHPAVEIFLPQCLTSIREKWEPETTERNLGLVVAARSRRKESVDWITRIQSELCNYGLGSGS